jgi:hypothetical protein
MSATTKAYLGWFLIWAVLSGMLVLARADMPSGYYMLLRCVICLFSAVFALAIYKEFDLFDEPGLKYKFLFFSNALVALLYNPVFPVYLRDKDLWTVINFITIVIFAGPIIALARGFAEDERKAREESKPSPAAPKSKAVPAGLQDHAVDRSKYLKAR